MKILVTIVAAALAVGAMGAEKLPPSNVDFSGFLQTSKRVQIHRQKRLVPLDAFLAMAKDPDTILLDTRSERAFHKKHIAGAVHLNFSDFTASKLAKLIPAKNTRILIYCNNNIDGDNLNFEGKALRMALNVPTFVNLYGYGYENVYELANLVRVDHKKLKFEGSEVK